MRSWSMRRLCVRALIAISSILAKITLILGFQRSRANLVQTRQVYVDNARDQPVRDRKYQLHNNTRIHSGREGGAEGAGRWVRDVEKEDHEKKEEEQSSALQSLVIRLAHSCIFY